MGYFAKINDGIVTEVISISNDVIGEPTLSYPETEGAGRAYIANTMKLPGDWRQCSYNSNFRGVYPGMGFGFDGSVFVPPANEEI